MMVFFEGIIMEWEVGTLGMRPGEQCQLGTKLVDETVHSRKASAYTINTDNLNHSNCANYYDESMVGRNGQIRRKKINLFCVLIL